MRRASINTWFRFTGGVGNVWAYSELSDTPTISGPEENSDAVIVDLALAWPGASCT